MLSNGELEEVAFNHVTRDAESGGGLELLLDAHTFRATCTSVCAGCSLLFPQGCPRPSSVQQSLLA
eukprot:1207440-Amphidinium_carterae.1